MDAQINQDYTASLTLTTTGISDLTVTATDRLTGAAIAAGLATEAPAGSGRYSYTLTAAQMNAVRRLRLVWQSALSGVYHETFLRVSNRPGWAITRRDVRQRAARQLDGPLAVWDLQATSGTTTTAIVPGLAYGGVDEYAGRWARFGSGSNAGQDRVITGYDQGTTTLTFAPALDVAIAAGDRIELYTAPAAVYDAAIHQAVAAVAERALAPFEERTIAGDDSTVEFSLPSDAVYIHSLQVYDADDNLLGALPRDWWMLLPNQKVLISQGLRTLDAELDPFRFRYDQLTLRPLRAGWTVALHGTARVEPPDDDDDTIPVAPDYLVAATVAHLARERADKAPLWPFYERARLEEWKKVSSNVPANSRRVP